TTHEFLFGAIVELIDNSRDANAERCDIFTVTKSDLRGGKMLCFYDNGCGMLPNEARNVMTFGYSAKRRDPSMIGQYGNGLKSGAMRIGKDMILFTKKDGVFTCLLLSRTFHEEENIDEVIIPTPSFNENKTPFIPADGDTAKHATEMEIILKYSPFHNLDDLLLQFDMIKGEHGTLIICYNLKLLESGDPELDFADPADVRLADPEGSDLSDAKFHLERISLRSYLSIIYANPRMKLYIQNKKIRTRRVVNTLYKVVPYLGPCTEAAVVVPALGYSCHGSCQNHIVDLLKRSTNFRSRPTAMFDVLPQSCAKRCKLQERVKENESKLAQFEKKFGSNPTKKDIRMQWRQLQDKVAISKQDMQRLKDSTDGKIKQLKEPKVLNFMFGINLERRTHDGCFIYNNGRLIKMYEKVGPQLEGTKKCCGVVGVVDIPFVVLEPTHNKQDFADSREYRQLLRAMGEHMDQYWRDLNLAAQPGGLIQFWQQFGYIQNDWNLPPANDEKYIKKRLMSVNLTLQCVYNVRSSDGITGQGLSGRESGDHHRAELTVRDSLPDYLGRKVGQSYDASLTLLFATFVYIYRPDSGPVKNLGPVDHWRRNLCLKWRVLPYESKQAKEEFLDTWSCIQNPDSACNKCSAPEKLPTHPVGKLEKEVITVDQKREMLEKKIMKQTAELEQISKKTDVKSKRDVVAAEARMKKQALIADTTPSRLSARQAAVKISRRKSPSPLPIPLKKPRTKCTCLWQADLRKQLESKSSESGSSDDEDEEESEDENDSEEEEEGEPAQLAKNRRPVGTANAKNFTAQKTPIKAPQTLSASSTSKIRGSRLPITSNTPAAENSTTNHTTASKTTSSARAAPAAPITVSLDKTSKNDKKNNVEKLEAHSTNATDDAAVVSSSNGLSQTPTSSSSNNSLSVASLQSQVDELSSRLRRFLYYFLPPNWNKLTKQQVGLLTPEELISKVDLTEFCQAYESGLKKLVADHQKTADAAQAKVKRIRSLSSTVLKRLKPDVDVEAGCETDDFDKIIETLAKDE
uniref:CW-type domain-containing protein n=1 Tax=Romanomermis culicivorax TaxID=13658 RepID=A0A915KTV1_ROMCU